MPISDIQTCTPI